VNHSRVDIQGSAISCGVTQISRISDDIDDVLFAIATRFYHAAHGQPPAFVIWSNLGEVETNGHRIAKRIEEQKFGTVTQSANEVNPNTGAVICVWLWQVGHEAYKEWYKATKIAKIAKQYPAKS
jgi:hypothetical protein